MDETLEYLKNDPDVEYAVPDDVLTPYNLVLEPMYEQQWGLLNEGINVIRGWDFATGEGITVGVMDTGIDTNHPDLQDNIISGGWDFVNDDNTLFDVNESEHGTNVAGIIASSADLSGIAGVAPNAKILPLKIIEGNIGYVSDAIEAIEYAKERNIKIMNCSFGTTEFNYALKDVMNNADMLFVCATGNMGESKNCYPASFELSNIISVGSMNFNEEASSFNNFGYSVDLYAPGENILTTSPNNTYSYVNGTSMSAAFVSGIAALVKEAVPCITSSELALALSQGYKKRETRPIRIASTYNTIYHSLPLNYIRDEDGRLSRAMKYANLLITPVVATILTQKNLYTELTQNEKNEINVFFSVTEAEMNICGNKGLDIIDSAILLLSSRKAQIGLTDIIAISEVYNDTDIFDNEIEVIKDLWDRIELSQTEKAEIIRLIKAGYRTSFIAKALVYSKAVGVNISYIIKTEDTVYDLSYLQLTDIEKDILSQVLQLYNLNNNAITYINNNNILPSALYSLLSNWQEENNFYIIGNSIVPYSTGSPHITPNNKYKISSSKWNNGNISIDKLDGMLSYSMPLLSLTGKNGLDLNLGIRFDPEVAKSVNTVKNPDAIENTYTVTETRTYYSLDRLSRRDDLDCIFTYQFNNINDAESYKAQDKQFFNDITDTSEEVSYYKEIEITANCTDININANTDNYYNSIYRLGVGWAFNLPSVEIDGTSKYIHLSDGKKFKVKADFSLDGYLLNNLNFSEDTSFTYRGTVSKYKLYDISGISYYFDNVGKCIGIRDLFNNNIFIQYSNYGIRKIIDTAGRCIYFSYCETSSYCTVSVTLHDSDYLYDDGCMLPIIGFEDLEEFIFADEIVDETALFTIRLDKDNDGKYSLSKVIDKANRSIEFTYETKNLITKLNNSSENINSGKYKVIKSVKSKTGAITEFTYAEKEKKFGPTGTESYCSVISSADLFNNNQSNLINYNIPNQILSKAPKGTVYPLVSVETDSSMTIDKTEEVCIFDDRLIPLATEIWENSGTSDNPIRVLKSITEYSEFNVYNLPTVTEEKTFSDSASGYTLLKTEKQWDDNGNCISTEVRSGNNIALNSYLDEKTLTSFSDGTNIATVSISYTHKKDGIYYGIKTVNTVNAQTHKITKTQNYSCKLNGVTTTEDKLLNYTDYEYNNSGQLTKTLLHYANNNLALSAENESIRVTETTYDDTGVYPSSTKKYGCYIDGNGNPVMGIKNAQGDFITEDSSNAVSQVYTQYNTLGQLVSSTDVNGKCTKYTYNSATNELEKTEYFDGNKKLGEETVIADYTTNTITSKDFNGVYTKQKYDIFGNLLKSYSQTKASVGAENPQFYLKQKNVYDEYNRLTDTYTMLSAVPEALSGEESLSGIGIEYIKESTIYDSLGRVIKTTVKDKTGADISASATYNYESGMQYGDSTESFNTVTKSLESGNTDNATYTNTQYYDSLGRLRIEEFFNTGTKIYTNRYSYSDFNSKTSSSGETITPEETDVIPEDNSTIISSGINVDKDGNITEMTKTEITDGIGQIIETIDGNGNSTYYTYDILGRVIKTKSPVIKSGETVFYSENLTFYGADGNICEQKYQNNKIGDSATYSSVKNQYDIFGRVISEEETIDNNGKVKYTQYYYEGNSTSPSRIYTGQSSLVKINGLDDIIYNGYYIDETNRAILGIYEKTDLQAFTRKLSNEYGIDNITVNNGTATITSGNIATGNLVNLYDSENYKAIVSGDIVSNGEADLIDLIRLKKYLAGACTLTDEQETAALLTNNTALSSADLAMLKK